MESRPRGLCLIINNMSFRDQNLHRLRANFDEQKLHDLFEKLHFEVCVFKDQHKHQMEWICASYGGGVDHSQYDAFVCIIMSHGTSGDKIMGVDGRTIGIVFQPCTVNEVFLSFNELSISSVQPLINLLLLLLLL